MFAGKFISVHSLHYRISAGSHRPSFQGLRDSKVKAGRRDFPLEEFGFMHQLHISPPIPNET